MLFTIAFLSPPSVQSKNSKSTCVFYGPNLPTEVLSQYSRIIVESDNVKPKELTALRTKGGKVFAYLSIGEVSPSRKWFKKIKREWILGDNKVWGSKVMDLSSSGWQNFVLDTIVTPLWEEGYRGLFLDTMDSFYIFAKDKKQQEKQAQSLALLLTKILERYPKMRFISNRGFEVLSSIGSQLEAVVAESLFYSWDNNKKRYKETSESDQEWLTNKLDSIKGEAGVDVIIIDYMPLEKRAEAKQLADKITARGYIPWVSIPSLDLAGIGSIEPKITTHLLLTDSKTDSHHPLKQERFKKLVSKFKTEDKEIKVHDIQTGMPQGHMVGRYASIISPITGSKQPKDYKDWLTVQAKEGIRINILK